MLGILAQFGASGGQIRERPALAVLGEAWGRQLDGAGAMDMDGEGQPLKVSVRIPAEFASPSPRVLEIALRFGLATSNPPRQILE